MNIALIDKETNICENVAVFDSLDIANEMFCNDFIITELIEGYSLGDTYKGGL